MVRKRHARGVVGVEIGLDSDIEANTVHALILPVYTALYQHL